MLKKLLSSFAKNPWKSYAVSVGADYIDGGFLHSVEIPMKLTTLNRSKLTTYFAGEEVKFMACIG